LKGLRYTTWNVTIKPHLCSRHVEANSERPTSSYRIHMDLWRGNFSWRKLTWQMQPRGQLLSIMMSLWKWSVDCVTTQMTKALIWPDSSVCYDSQQVFEVVLSVEWCWEVKHGVMRVGYANRKCIDGQYINIWCNTQWYVEPRGYYMRRCKIFKTQINTSSRKWEWLYDTVQINTIMIIFNNNDNHLFKICMEVL